MLGLVVVLSPNCVSGSAEQPPFIPKSAAAGPRLNALSPAPPGMRAAPGVLGLLSAHLVSALNVARAEDLAPGLSVVVVRSWRAVPPVPWPRGARRGGCRCFRWVQGLPLKCSRPARGALA